MADFIPREYCQFSCKTPRYSVAQPNHEIKTPMKTSFLICLAIIASLGAANSTSLGKDKEPAAKTTAGKAFDMTGTVTKYEVGICMQSDVKYDLHPATGTAVHLSDGHRHDLLVLEEATRTGKPVRVEGTEESGPECQYVKVTKATPATEKPKAK